MINNYRVFGNAFDPANSPERLNLKRAYLSYIQNNNITSSMILDPYDMVKADFDSHSSCQYTWAGKVPLESWLTPRPQTGDLPLLNPAQCALFLKQNKCWDYALRTAEFVEQQIFPDFPIMIGVDHSVTLGPLLALSKIYDNINIVILDAHFDVMKFSKSAFDDSGQQLLFCHCGNFLSYVLEKEIISPENLCVLGIGEAIATANNSRNVDEISGRNAAEARRWINEGVHLWSKEEVESKELNLNLTGPTYISIDMDIGSLSSVYSARYMTCYGLSVERFISLLSNIALTIKGAGVPLLGLDVMETDIHLLEAVKETSYQDHTLDIIREIFRLFLAE